MRAESYCRAERGRAHSQSQVFFVLGKAEILKKILARRARVRDDSGRSLYFEIDLERSFDGTLSRQSVYEQTSGVLRHTESVRDGKVQEQDWRQALEQKSRAPPARPSDYITAQSHSVPGGQSVSDIQVRTLRTVADARSNDPVRTAAQGQWWRTTRPQVSEALFLQYLISSSSQVARPPTQATAQRSPQSPQVSREVCVCSCARQ